MKRSIIALATASALVLTSGVAFAQKGRGGGGGQAAKGPASHAPKTMPQGPKSPGMQGPKSPKSPGTHGPKSTAAQGPKSTAAQGPKTTAANGPKTKAARTTTAAATTTPTGTSLTLTAVQQKLQRNTNLANKLETRLPAGTNLMTAAEGFRNLGQFVAAVNVSNNLDIPFNQLKARMVDDGMSLGQAIQTLRSDVDATTAVRRAETDATRVISDAERSVSKTKKTKKNGGQ